MGNRDYSDDDSLIISAIRNPTKAVQLAGESFRRNIKEIADKQFPLPFEPNQIDLANRKINWRPGQKEKLANDSVSFAAGNSPAMALTFIGKGAKTWDEKAAKKAAALLSRGVDPEKVWQRHMTGQMPDGALFQEIDDSNIPMKRLLHENELFNYPSVKDVLPHKELFKAYPEINNVRLAPELGGSLGSFDSVQNIASIKPIDAGSITNPAESLNRKSTLLHELQHAIQQREGWARGGSGHEFLQPMKQEKAAIENQISALNEEMRKAVGTPQYSELMDKRSELVRRLSDKGYMNTIDMMDVANKQYRNLAGEAQARATQERMGMDMAERRANYPLKNNKLADVLLSDLIYKYGDNGKAMSVGLPETEFSKAHALAQKNAALPVEQGGLGLHPDNTAMERARALGFDTNKEWFHGSKSKFDEFNPELTGKNYNPMYGDGFYFASKYGHAAEHGDVSNYYLNAQNPMGYSLSNKIQADNKGINLSDLAKENGHDSIDAGDVFNVQRVIFDPKKIRSINAAFDPLKKNSANILAGAALGSTLLEKDKKRKDK